MKRKCIITVGEMGQDFSDGIRRLEALGYETYWDKKLLNSKDSTAVINSCKDFDYVIAGSENWSADTLNGCPNLKCIVRFGVGYDDVDISAAAKRGIPVSNIPGSNSTAVAEHAVGMMIASARIFKQRDYAIRNASIGKTLYCSPSLRGSTVGIIGLGSIGKEVVKLLSGFSCTIFAYDLYKDLNFCQKYNIRYTDLETLLAESDFISIHSPLTPETKHMINQSTIQKMKKNAILINTSRGGLVNSADLASALKNGEIFGAGLDVFEDEGRADTPMAHDFFDIENVILTPHASSHTIKTFSDMLDACIDIIDDYDKGQPLKNILNKEYIQYLSSSANL